MGGVNRAIGHDRLRAAQRAPHDLTVKLDYLGEHGHPIRYGYVRSPWPLSAYQTVYGNEPGSAELPSAGRAFTPELLTVVWVGIDDNTPLGMTGSQAALPMWTERPRVEGTRTILGMRVPVGGPLRSSGHVRTHAPLRLNLAWPFAASG